MALPNKNSRKITVGGEIYRWIISPQGKSILFVSELEEFKGRRIEVRVNTDVRNFGFNSLNEEEVRIIKPRDAESIITQAIKLGWDPKEKGSPIVFDLEGELLIRL